MRLPLIALTLALIMSTASAQTGLASVEFEDQTSDGTFVTVQQVTLSNGGFVVIHDDTYEEDPFGSVVGVSEYLEIGTHDDVRVNVTLDMTGGSMTNQTSGNGTGQAMMLVAMPHFDSNDNQHYDFESSNGTDDGPYTDGGAAEVDEAEVTVEQGTQPAQPGDQDEVEDPETDTPGLAVWAALGVVAAVAAIRRRH